MVTIILNFVDNDMSYLAQLHIVFNYLGIEETKEYKRHKCIEYLSFYNLHHARDTIQFMIMISNLLVQKEANWENCGSSYTFSSNFVEDKKSVYW